MRMIKYIDNASVTRLHFVALVLQNNQILLKRHVITTNWNEVGTSLDLKAAFVLFSPASFTVYDLLRLI